MRWLNRSPLQNKFAWSGAICVPSACLNSLLTRGLFARVTKREKLDNKDKQRERWKISPPLVQTEIMWEEKECDGKDRHVYHDRKNKHQMKAPRPIPVLRSSNNLLYIDPTLAYYLVIYYECFPSALVISSGVCPPLAISTLHDMLHPIFACPFSLLCSAASVTSACIWKNKSWIYSFKAHEQ